MGGLRELSESPQFYQLHVFPHVYTWTRRGDLVKAKPAEPHLVFDAWSVNSVATREKYFLILIQRSGLGMQPLCAWMAWIRAISLAIILGGKTQTDLSAQHTLSRPAAWRILLRKG